MELILLAIILILGTWTAGVLMGKLLVRTIQFISDLLIGGNK